MEKRICELEGQMDNFKSMKDHSVARKFMKKLRSKTKEFDNELIQQGDDDDVLIQCKAKDLQNLILKIDRDKNAHRHIRSRNKRKQDERKTVVSGFFPSRDQQQVSKILIKWKKTKGN